MSTYLFVILITIVIGLLVNMFLLKLSALFVKIKVPSYKASCGASIILFIFSLYILAISFTIPIVGIEIGFLSFLIVSFFIIKAICFVGYKESFMVFLVYIFLSANLVLYCLYEAMKGLWVEAVG